MKRLLILFFLLVYISIMLFGCTIINVGNAPESKDVSVYSVIYLTEPLSAGIDTAESLQLDEALVTRLEVILSGDAIHSKLHEQYPDTDYSCNLENISNTHMYKIVVTGTDETNLPKICNEITGLLQEEASAQLPDLSIKIVRYAEAGS